jgi:competence protein ComEC
VLYDAGPRFGDRFDSGEQIVTPLLRQLGVGRLDAFVISHRDNDHAGGMQSVIRNFEVNRVIASFGDLSADCSTPHAWSIDGINFEIFSAVDEEARSRRLVAGNDLSCVLLAFNREFGFLVTGDIEEFAESVLQDRNLPDVDVVTVPHHGSRTSSTPGFINHVQPSLAIVSAGFQNRFNHPDPLVLTRYRQRYIKVLNTAEHGAISLLLGRGGILKLELTRSERRRFWHRKP